MGDHVSEINDPFPDEDQPSKAGISKSALSTSGSSKSGASKSTFSTSGSSSSGSKSKNESSVSQDTTSGDLDEDEVNDAYASLLQVMQTADGMVTANMKEARHEVLERQVPLFLEHAASRAVQTQLESKMEELITKLLPEMLAKSQNQIATLVSNAIQRTIGEAGATILPLLADGSFVCANPCSCPPGCRGVQHGNPPSNQQGGGGGRQ